MTTNPTPPTAPLSAEDVAWKIDDTVREIKETGEWEIDIPKATKIIEAYVAQEVAQQATPLTATIAVLMNVLEYYQKDAFVETADGLFEWRGTTDFSNEVEEARTNLPAAAQAHLNEVEKLKAENETLREQNLLIIENNRATEAENERLNYKNEQLTKELEECRGDLLAANH